MRREELNFILQKTDLSELRELYKNIKKKHVVTILQSPTQQTLLQPVYDPISNGEFYGGEILVTTTIVTVGNQSNKGWAMVLDDHEKLSLYIAVCDGAYAAGYFKDEIIKLVKDSKRKILLSQLEENKKVNSTKVSFDLMAQG
ncbi:MAG: phosphonate C-P lyase system protein PhnG [Sulfurospirillaceae bacterium]|nr:phosphonate C-P lyase system protein PhnG [Sulfurospirillaceae bacterium]